MTLDEIPLELDAAAVRTLLALLYASTDATSREAA